MLSEENAIIIAVVVPGSLALIGGIYYLNLFIGLYIYRRIIKLQSLDTDDARRKVAYLSKLEENGKLFRWGRYAYLGMMILYPVIRPVNSVVGWMYLVVGRARNKAGKEPLKVFGRPTDGSQVDVEARAVGMDIELGTK
ncbi:hypothetical protein G7Y79_00041g077980 [Physcia stellaris]|nr:hypothetical protein G7Y79_00041g077980 [Physcia stellaris]